MYKCDGCGCMAFDRITLENGQKVCDYCAKAYDTVKKPQHKPREYNNLVWLIKQDHGTIKKWCKKHGLSVAVAEAVLNKQGHYACITVEEMSAGHLDVLIAAQKDGYEKTLILEEYVEV